MSKIKNKNLLGMFLALMGFAFYTCMDATTKYTVTYYHISWQEIVFYVSCFSSLGLFIYISLKREESLRLHNVVWGILKAVLSMFSIITVFFALPNIQLDLFYSIIFVSPIIGSVLAMVFLKERLNIHKSFSLLLGLLGIIVITQPWNASSIGGLAVLSMLATLYCASVDASNGIFMQKFLYNDRPITLIFYQYLSGILFGAIILLHSKGGIPLPHAESIYPMILIALFGILGSALVLKGLQMGAVQLVLSMGYSQMVFGIIAGIILFSQKPRFNTLLGCLFIIIASCYISLYASFTRGKKNKSKWNKYLFVINKIRAKFHSHKH